LKQKIQDFIEEEKINVADEQKAPKNPNVGVFKNSPPNNAPVSTCWAEEVSDFQHPPTITIMNAINTILSGFVRKIPPTGSS